MASDGKKILLVEDEADITTILAFRLSKIGFTVLEARTGAQGLEMARSNRPDLIILDLMLPELPGEEVCKAIREDMDEVFARTPIIMVTAKDSEVDQIIGRSIGANSYVTKPFDVEVLLKEIHKLLQI
ncbi:MAG: response regulator transcription factor [Candidatus Omnitrophota bacterium]